MIKNEYLRKTIQIAWPCIFENIMASVIIFADTIMVGSLGPVLTAGVAINSSVSWLLNSLPVCLSVGGTVLVARHIGANEIHNANKVANQCMGAGFILNLLVTIIMLFFSSFIPIWMGAKTEVLPFAVTYLRIYCLGIFLNFTGLIAAGLLRGAGNTKTPMTISFLTNILNVIGNFFLIYPSRSISIFNLRLPMWGANLGVAGAAISTIISQGVFGIVLLFLLFRGKEIVKIEFKNLFLFNKDILGKVLSVGFPATGERIAVNIGQVLFQRIIATMGTIVITAHHLAVTTESLSYMPAYGFSVAATTLVSQSLGAKNENDAIKYARVNLNFGIAVGIICCLIFLIFPEYLISLFSKDTEVIRQGAIALRVMSFAEVFSCLNSVFTGILRGGGDTKAPLFASIAGMWGFRIILAYIFAFIFNMGLMGAWLAMAIDHFARVILLWIRYKKRKWIKIF